MNTYKQIEDLRIVAGTLPSERPKRQTSIVTFPLSCEVSLIDHNKNPYRAMFSTATATWGDNEYVDKWPITSPEGRLEVIKAVLTGNTLPQARELINFIFRIRGVPRWLFDHHTQVPFTTFMSVGCRDNNKVDCDIVKVDEYRLDSENKVFENLKDFYEDVLSDDMGSWQSARAFLPQSYQHSYYIGQNLLSMANMRFTDSKLDEHLKVLYTFIFDTILEKFPIIGQHVWKHFDNSSWNTIESWTIDDVIGTNDWEFLNENN